MTLAIFLVGLLVLGVYFAEYGPILIGELTVWRAGFFLTTASAAIFCYFRGGRPFYGAALAIIAYAMVATSVYAIQNEQHALLWSAALDLTMAAYFILTGRQRWELYAGLMFLAAVSVSVLSAGGLVPSHVDRFPTLPYVFIAFTQPDLTAILGHMANIVIGTGAGDGSGKLALWFRQRFVAADYVSGHWARLNSSFKASKKG